MRVIDCPDCGEPLADELDQKTVMIDGKRFPLRRGSDHIACGACGSVHRVRALRAVAVAQGDLAPTLPESSDADVTERAEEIVGEILEALEGDGERDRTEPPPDDG